MGCPGNSSILNLQHHNLPQFTASITQKMSVALNRNSLTAPVFTKFSKLKQELQVSNSNALMTTIFIFW